MAGLWRLARMDGAEELAALKGEPIEEHRKYTRENNGDWIICDDDGRVCTVAFKGNAKRGMRYSAPDPEGLRTAKMIVALVNAAKPEGK